MLLRLGLQKKSAPEERWAEGWLSLATAQAQRLMWEPPEHGCGAARGISSLPGGWSSLPKQGRTDGLHAVYFRLGGAPGNEKLGR